MKKVLDQTVRDLKREVNKMVLKVPSIEQKTLDATSNEPWAPRGSLMAEIAQASCNYNDYQLVMTVLWKRIQDTGKNWRHVYKALSVLEYLAIYGSERVVDDIREHAYQISTLSDFLYTDSNGRDQGSNVRRKSQSLVALVNNKKRLQEVRDKALANKVSWPPLSSSARYNDEHFEGGNRGFGLVQRDLVLKDKDRYRDGGDKYSQDRPRSPSVDVYSNNSFDDYDRHSTRIDAPPSYEGASKDSCSVVQNDKSGPTETSSRDTNLASGSVAGESAQAHEKEVASFDEFDPRGSVTASPTVESSGLELDIFGLSAVDYTDSSASMLVTSIALPDDDMLTSSAHAVPIEPDENPFGDAPFKAIPRENFPSETNATASATPDVANGRHSLANSDFHAANSSKDILDGILPWTGPVASISDQSHFLPQRQSSHSFQFSLETGDLQLGQTNPFELPAFQPSPPTEIHENQMNSTEISVLSAEQWPSHTQTPPPPPPPAATLQRPMESSSGVPVSSPAAQQAASMPAFTFRSSLPDLPTSSPGSAKPPPSGEKFEPKSAIWADTMSRGLVNLNISGPRTNPLADIGVDFDDINRKERRNEARGSQSPLPSSFAMGKAMGIGSGLGRAATGTFTFTPPPQNPSMASNMAMGQPSLGMGMEMPASHGPHTPMNARGRHAGQFPP